jgi:hypothetical protein
MFPGKLKKKNRLIWKAGFQKQILFYSLYFFIVLI